MSVPAENLSFPIPKCNSCKDPLTDATWKNCDNCRTTREDYPLSSMPRLDHLSESESPLPSAPTSNQTVITLLDSTTSFHAPSPGPSHYRDPSGNSRLANDQPRRSSAPALPRPAEAIEYQWSDGLIDALLALPPRSKHIGKFSIIADPTVNNSTRAHLFFDQLHARAVPISCVATPPPSHIFHNRADDFFLLSVLAQGPATADFHERGQQQFVRARVLLHLSGRVSGSVCRICR